MDFASRALAVMAAGVAAMAAPPAAQAQEPRPCTPLDLTDVRDPLHIEDPDAPGIGPDVLIAGRTYRATVRPYLAAGDETEPQDGSFAIAGPPGLVLTPETAGSPAWRFVAPGTGPVTLTLNWRAQRRDDPFDVCQASTSRELAVRRLELVTVGRGRWLTQPGGYNVFALPFGVPEPALKEPVTARLWISSGTTAPPRPQGRPAVTATVRPNDYGYLEPVRRAGERRLRGARVSVDPLGRHGFSIVPTGNWRFGLRMRLGFRIEVRQAGERIGGHAAGAVCRRVQLARWSVLRCRAARPS